MILEFLDIVAEKIKMKGLILSFIFLLLVIQCQARIITVDEDGPADFNNIQAAISDSNDGDIIEVQPGIYTGLGNRNIDFGGKAITVRSTNGPANCIIDCNSDPNNLHRGFYFHTNEDANSVLDGFKIINGQEEFGGGIYCNGSEPLIKNCVFYDNLALRIETSEFGTEYYGKGGGVCFGSGITARIVNCLFYNNSAYFGGNAIYCGESAPVIEKCIFTENHGSMRGGAIYLYKSNARVVNCLITGNSSVEYGGAIACKGDYHTPEILQCTIRGDSSGRGGAFDLIATTATITNCILWGNSPTEIAHTATGTANVEYSDIQGGWAGTGNIDVDPLFVGSGDYHLVFGSPCIDSATNSPPVGLPPTDLDGTVRPFDGDNDGDSIADMGAYEFEFDPGEPVLAVVPGTFRFSCPPGGPDPETRFLYIWNAGGEILDWQITGAGPWLNVEPNNGASAGEIDIIDLTIDSNGLASDLYECVITVMDPCDVSRIRNIPVTFRVGPKLRVPADYNTIQASVDAAFNGDEIIVSNGTYTGNGNRDIDFKGKAVTVRSEDNNPFSCIIDCQGSSGENHRGFYFNSGENEDSVLSGFMIKNGYVSQGNLPEGGGIFCLNQHTDPTIKNCIVINNKAHSGGGISCHRASPTIRNCIVADNDAYYDKGGGILCWDNSNAKIIGCTIVFNTAKYNSGGTYFYGGSPVLTNSILWGNNLQQIRTAASSTLSVSYCDVQGSWTGSGNINQDPCFVDVLGQDYHLSQDSPCIDAGDPNFGPLPFETDIDSGRRKVGDRVDIGADELRDLLADMDEDGDIDTSDLAMLAQGWMTDHGGQGWDWNQDLNKDGTINFTDYAIFAGNYGQELDSESPSQPGNLTLTDANDSLVSLNWDDSTDNIAVAGYRIYRNGSYLSYSLSNSFSDSNVDPGSIYIYQVSAYDAVYNESEPSSPCIVTTGTLN